MGAASAEIDLDLNFSSRSSVWRILQEHLKPSEAVEARRIIGNALIEKNEELHQEAATLLEILRDYNREVENRVQAVQWQSRLSRDFRKETLEQEIHNFISALRSKTSTPHSLRPSTARERTVLSFFVSDDEPGIAVRPKSAKELLSSRNTSDKGAAVTQDIRPKTADLLSAVLSNKSDSTLIYERLETVASAIRQELLAERQTLLDDIEFLHFCIDNEHERDLTSHIEIIGPPTESELLDFKGKLQVELALLGAEHRASSSGGRLAPLDGSQLSQVAKSALKQRSSDSDKVFDPARNERGDVDVTRPSTRLGLPLSEEEEAFLFCDSDNDSALPSQQVGNAEVLVVSDSEDGDVDSSSLTRGAHQHGVNDGGLVDGPSKSAKRRQDADSGAPSTHQSLDGLDWGRAAHHGARLVLSAVSKQKDVDTGARTDLGWGAHALDVISSPLHSPLQSRTLSVPSPTELARNQPLCLEDDCDLDEVLLHQSREIQRLLASVKQPLQSPECMALNPRRLAGDTADANTDSRLSRRHRNIIAAARATHATEAASPADEDWLDGRLSSPGAEDRSHLTSPQRGIHTGGDEWSEDNEGSMVREEPGGGAARSRQSRSGDLAAASSAPSPLIRAAPHHAPLASPSPALAKAPPRELEATSPDLGCAPHALEGHALGEHNGCAAPAARAALRPSPPVRGQAGTSRRVGGLRPAGSTASVLGCAAPRAPLDSGAEAAYVSAADDAAAARPEGGNGAGEGAGLNGGQGLPAGTRPISARLRPVYSLPARRGSRGAVDACGAAGAVGDVSGPH